jgi:hypothetical protein
MHSFQIKRMEEESTKKKFSIRNLFKGQKSQSEAFTIKNNMGILKGSISLATAILGVLKDRKGKLSSKRTVTGILATAAFLDMELKGVNQFNLILAALSIIPILFTVFERE